MLDKILHIKTKLKTKTKQNKTKTKQNKKQKQNRINYFTRTLNLTDENALPSKENFVLFRRGRLYHITQQTAD